MLGRGHPRLTLFKPRLSRDVANLVHTPTIAAYFMSVVEHKWYGLALYLVFALMAFRAGLFRRLGEWPPVSKVALLVGPLLVASAFVLDIDVIRYWAILPGALYTILSWYGGAVLRKANLD